MIRFYFRSGSEATTNTLTALINQDLTNGTSVLLLVPEQQTVSVERRMLEALPAHAQLSFEVVNFSRLANRVFRTVGGHSWSTAGPAHRALVMWQALRETAPFLQQYEQHAAEPKLCELMLQTASHCKAYNILADDLLKTAEQLEPDEPLRAKLTDIGTVLGCFERQLAVHFDNGEEELDRLAAALVQHGKQLFGDTHIYVDSFTDYTGQELAVLRELMRVSPCVTFTLPQRSIGDDGLHLATARQTYKQLSRIAKELSLEVFFAPPKAVRPDSAAAYLAEHLFDLNAEPAPLALRESPNLSLCVCPTPFDEADAVVARIHQLVREGCRYRDITVVVRDANAYCGILDAAMEREGIPYFLSEKTDITVRPLIKLILLALRIRLNGWRDEDIVGYLKTGLCGIAPDDINLFEEYTSVWHPRGEQAYNTPFTRNPDGYTTAKSARAVRILEGANRARALLVPPLLSLFSELKSSQNATEMCRALYRFLSALSIGEQLKAQASERLAAGERREAEELSRLYGVTVDALDCIAAAIGEEVLDVAQFAEALKLVFSRTDIGSIPTSTDEVTVGSASMLRTDHPRFVLVLGLCEGEFPRNVTDDGLISDTEKERLFELGLELPSGKAERASNEMFYLYRALSAPREGLYLSYSKQTTTGQSTSPSIAIQRLERLFPDFAVTHFEKRSPLDYIYSPAAALDLYGALSESERAIVRWTFVLLNKPQFETLLQPINDPDVKISKEAAEALFQNKHLSPSHLESYASCRFAYYCSKILRLREEHSGSLELSDTGTFLHYVLEEVMRTVKQEGRSFSSFNETECEQLVKRICDAYTQELVEAGGPLNSRAKALLDRLAVLARLVVSNIFEELSDSLFTPAFTELDLRDVGATALKLEDGSTLPITGKADRVDVWESPEHGSFLRVIDYKTGTRKFSPDDIKKGMSLQMPLYLRALCATHLPALNEKAGLPPHARPHPAGITYFSTAISAEMTPGAVPREQALQNAKQRLQRSGVMLSEYGVPGAVTLSQNPTLLHSTKNNQQLSTGGFDTLFADLDQTICAISKEMKTGSATAKPNPYADRSACEYCPFGAVCRAKQKF